MIGTTWVSYVVDRVLDARFSSMLVAGGSRALSMIAEHHTEFAGISLACRNV